MTDKALEVSPETNTATSIIQVIERAAMNPDVDMEKMERLLAMQERILDRQGEVDFSEAMARVQAELPTVVKDAFNQQTSSKYAKHEALAKAIKPIYTREGFSITFSEGEAPKEGFIRIIGVLRHRAGYKESHHIDLPLDIAGIKGSVNKTPTHATGSTFSYGRRYLTCLIFDVLTWLKGPPVRADSIADISVKALATVERAIEAGIKKQQKDNDNADS